MLDGADGVIWADAKLTHIGQNQARDVHDLWKAQLPKGIPAPETFYVSPLTRTIETAELSFKGLELPEDRPYKPLIKEVRRSSSYCSHNCIAHHNISSLSAKLWEFTPATTVVPRHILRRHFRISNLKRVSPKRILCTSRITVSRTVLGNIVCRYS